MPTATGFVENGLVLTGRTVGAVTLELVGYAMALGESVEIDITVNGFTEATGADTCAWQAIGKGRRTSAGVSSRTTSAAGAGAGQIDNTFAPTRPTFVFSDPASAVAPNTLNRFSTIVTGKTGVTIDWVWSYKTIRGTAL
jgi:hypothetical protein